METEILDGFAPDAIEYAAQLLRQGELVAFPTDTVYGVGALAFDAAAIAKLYTAKGRPLDKAIPILVSDIEQLEQIAAAIPDLAQHLIARHWPGPLTLILPKRDNLPANISSNAGIATRIPDHDICRSLIRAAGGAVATTSANLSGEREAQTAAEAYAYLKGEVAAVVDGGPAKHAIASTIINCLVNPPQIVRQGPVAVQLPSAIEDAAAPRLERPQ